MAFRINTVEYAWETQTNTISGSVLYTSPTKSIYIAETGSRTFLTAELELLVRDGWSGATGTTTQGGVSIGLYIDNNYVSQSFYSSVSTAAGDHVFFQYNVDFKNHFNTYFVSQSHPVQFTFASHVANSWPFTNHIGRLILTYRYDDAGIQYGTKTVRIPIEMVTSTVGTSYAGPGVGTGPVFPALDTWLPETNKSYKDLFIQFIAKDAANATTQVSASVRFDGTTEYQRIPYSSSLNTSLCYFDLLNLSGSIDTSTTHSIQYSARLAGRILRIGGFINATYTYDYYNSSRIMNSIILPTENETPFVGAGYNIVDNLSFFVPESNPTLKESAIFSHLYVDVVGGMTYYVSGSGATLSITTTVGSSESGPQPFLLRFDPDSRYRTRLYDQILNFKRGQNKMSFIWASALASGLNGYGMNLLAYVNYESDNMNGPGKHNHTIYISSASMRTNNLSISTINTSYLSDLSASVFYNNGKFVTATSMGNSPNSRTSVIGVLSRQTFLNDVSQSLNSYIQGRGDAIPSLQIFNFVVNDRYRNYYEQLDNRQWFDTFTESDIISYGAASFLHSIGSFITIHENVYPVSCSLLNCNYPNQTYNILFYTSGSTTNPILRLQLSGSSTDKSGSTQWYDNFQNLYAICTSPEFGISNMLPANSGSYVINFSTGSVSSGGEKSFTFIG